MSLSAAVRSHEPVLHAYRREPRTSAPVALDGVNGFDGVGMCGDNQKHASAGAGCVPRAIRLAVKRTG